MTKYNGWANYETWNVSLWIMNDYNLYSQILELKPNNYKNFIKSLGLEKDCTPDGVAYMSNKLSYDELDERINELVEDL